VYLKVKRYKTTDNAYIKNKHTPKQSTTDNWSC